MSTKKAPFTKDTVILRETEYGTSKHPVVMIEFYPEGQEKPRMPMEVVFWHPSLPWDDVMDVVKKSWHIEMIDVIVKLKP